LEDWESSSELFKKRLDTYKKDQNVLRNEIYQGVGFFSAFQGLLLTAVAQSTLLSCKNLIFPFLLSAIATVTTVALVL
jgi:preprotein translocase subunit SecB